jgi:hypothetical protein
MPPRTVVMMPMKDEGELAARVLTRLRGEPRERVQVVVCDNGSGSQARDQVEPFLGPGCVRLEMPDLGLYGMWHVIWETAARTAEQLEQSEWEVAFLNSDIDLLPGSIMQMREALREHDLGAIAPDYNRRCFEGREVPGIRQVKGSYRHGGMPGWCFMLRGELYNQGLRIDRDFEWWCGDDDVFFQVEQLGWPLGILEGLPVDHVGEATARHHDWTELAKARDMKRLEAKWGAR